MAARGARERRRRDRRPVLDPVSPAPVSPRTCAPSSRRRGDARDRGDGRQRVLGGCPFRLGAPLRRRAAVPRGGLQARDPRAHDRHVARALGARHGAARGGPPRAVAPRPIAGRRHRRSSRGAGAGDGKPRRSLRDGPRRRLARGVESTARADVPARMGSRVVRLDRALAAVRRCRCAAAHGVVCARHRAVDEHAQSRAGRRRRDGDRARVRETSRTTSLRARLLHGA